MEKVSVALAVYNGEKYLPQLLASLNAQTVKPFELVVVDDGSTDNSLQVIHSFPLSFEKKIFSNEKNSGPVYTFKKLAELCSGNYIAFCDQDDVWMPEKIDACLSAVKNTDHSVPVTVFSDLSIIDEENHLLHPSFFRLRRNKPEKFSLRDILFANIVTGCASLINKAMANELKQMPLNVMMHDHWMALISYSFGKYVYINKPLVLYRAHGSNVTDKNEASVIKNLLGQLKNKPGYLRSNIQQAISFQQLYFNKLNKTDKKALTHFIALQQKPFFYKRLMRDKTSLIRKLKEL